MGVLENALSEEMDLPASSSSSRRNSLGDGIRPRRAQPRAQEKNKVIAAAVGATLTSLTMTPFDVVKTRLQTQATPEFVPSSHLPPPNRSATTPWPPPVASTSSAPPPASASSVANPGTCCTKTYFSSNKDKSLLCRFDPRLSSSSLPASGSHGVSVSSTPAAVYRNMSGATAFVHQLAPSPALVHAPAPISASSCLYPTLEAAAALSLPTSSSSALGGGGGGHAAHTPRHFTGFFDAVHQIVKHEGLGAMWRGTAPALAMSIPGQVVYMVGYDWGRRTAFAHAPSWAYQDSDAVSNGSATATTDGLKPTYLTAVPLVAGALSRTVVAALTSPLELVRTRLQSSSTNTSIASIIASVRADAGGLSSAWRGLPPTLWRDVPFSAVYWAGYEGIKRALTGGKGMGEGWEGQSAGGEFAVAFVAGAGSGMIAATLTNPFDVVKTRRQAVIESAGSLSSSSSRTPPALTKTFPILADIARREGWAGLMRGLTPRLAKVGPACGIMIASYEGLSLVLDQRQ